MKNPLRGLHSNWHIYKGTKTYTLDGVTVSTAPDDLPRFIRRMLFRNKHEQFERALIGEIIKPDSRVLEIGCGIGLVSLVTRKQCSQGVVRSYEANPRMETIIRKNYALNGWEPDLVMKAITADGADLEFFIDDNILSSSATDRGIEATKTVVQSECFDDIIKEFKPDTIIMDVEGAEDSLFKSSKLKGVKQMVVELHPHIIGEDVCDNLIKNLDDMGFKTIQQSEKVYHFKRTYPVI